MEEEAKVGYLADSEFWLFTDNLTAESCFYKGGLSSKTLHKLVLRLKRAELETEFMLFVVHMAGMRMIAQGTDGFSCGIILKGMMLGKNMLHFVPFAQSARESVSDKPCNAKSKSWKCVSVFLASGCDWATVSA